MNNEEDSRAIAIADKAFQISMETRERCIKAEERTKSLQRRMDNQDMKMNAILLDLKDIKHSMGESKATQRSIKRQVSIFMGLISAISAIGGIIRVIFMILDRIKG